MLSILTSHAPGQRQRSHRRRQPAWWDADCLAACVARNGALQDHHRVRSEESLHAVQRSTATVHRTVRATRRNFWSLWQNHVSSLSAHNPRVAASIIRFSSATPIPGRLSVFSGLTIQTLLRGTIQWHSGGSTFRQLGCILRSRLMRRSFKR